MDVSHEPDLDLVDVADIQDTVNQEAVEIDDSELNNQSNSNPPPPPLRRRVKLSLDVSNKAGIYHPTLPVARKESSTRTVSYAVVTLLFFMVVLIKLNNTSKVQDIDKGLGILRHPVIFRIIYEKLVQLAML